MRSYCCGRGSSLIKALMKVCVSHAFLLLSLFSSLNFKQNQHLSFSSWIDEFTNFCCCREIWNSNVKQWPTLTGTRGVLLLFSWSKVRFREWYTYRSSGLLNIILMVGKHQHLLPPAYRHIRTKVSLSRWSKNCHRSLVVYSEE